jgi:hypothetical protein
VILKLLIFALNRPGVILRTGKGKGYFDSNQTVSERTRLMLHFRRVMAPVFSHPVRPSTVYALCSLITSLVRRQPATGIALCSLITSLVP